jgi:hypothetical protein
MQSKQVSASASRSIVNYQLTCGFSASVLAVGCAERGQRAASQAARAAVLAAVKVVAAGIFRAAGIRLLGRKCAGFDSPRGF